MPALYGLLACAALMGIGISMLPHGWRRIPLAVGVTGLALAPVFGGESPAMWLHGALGTPSVTLLALAIRRVLAPVSPPLLTRPAAAFILGVAAVIYPAALGWGPLDPYALGYQPRPILVALAPFGAGLAWRRNNAWLLILGVGVLAYATGIFGNLWNALFDPLLVVIAAITLVKGLARR